MTVRLPAVSRETDNPRLRRLEHAQMLRGSESIKAAVANASNPGLVELAPDEWRLSGSSVSISRQLTMRGRGYPTTISVDSGVGAAITITAAGTRLEGIRLISTGATMAVIVMADNVSIVDCVFEGFAGAIQLRNCSRPVVKCCRFTGHTGTAVALTNADYGIISDNLFVNTAGQSEIDADSDSTKNIIANNNTGDGLITHVAASANVVADNQGTVTAS